MAQGNVNYLNYYYILNFWVLAHSLLNLKIVVGPIVEFERPRSSPSFTTTIAHTGQRSKEEDRSGESMPEYLNKGNKTPHLQPTTANESLQKALAERERFLNRQPHLRAYQAEIDRILDKSGNPEGRMAVLGMLLQGKLLDMQRELYKLTKILQQNANSL